MAVVVGVAEAVGAGDVEGPPPPPPPPPLGGLALHWAYKIKSVEKSNVASSL